MDDDTFPLCPGGHPGGRPPSMAIPSADPAARLRAFATALDDGLGPTAAAFRAYPDEPFVTQRRRLADDLAAVLLYVPEPEITL